MSTDPDLADHSVIRPEEDVIVRRMGESAVLVHLSTNQIYELNETGTRIWELLEQGRSSTEINDQLCAEFTVSSTEAREAYNNLLTHLLDKALIRRETP